MPAIIETIFDHTTNFNNLSNGDIETAQQEIFTTRELEEGQFPEYAVQVILSHGEHADLDKIYKYIVNGRENIYTMLDGQAEWFNDLNLAVERAKELDPSYERVRVVYTVETYVNKTS